MGTYGGAKRDRTADLYNAIVALYQLSYGPDRTQMLWFCGFAVNGVLQNFIII